MVRGLLVRLLERDHLVPVGGHRVSTMIRDELLQYIGEYIDVWIEGGRLVAWGDLVRVGDDIIEIAPKDFKYSDPKSTIQIVSIGSIAAFEIDKY